MREVITTRAPTLTGCIFGRWLVLERAPNKGRKARWVCVCVCQTVATVWSTSLLSGKSKSCGCGRIEAITTHGMKGTRQHEGWRGMRKRCNSPNDPAYRWYGAKGVKVCDEWNNSFKAFWRDMGPTYFEGATLDRIDSKKGYNKDNCRWLTKSDNSKHRWNRLVIWGAKN